MSVPNVIYNVNVKSKFELFLNDELCETEPDELVKKINEDKKRKEVAQKEAKKQKQNETKKIVLKSTPDPEPMKPDEKRNGDKAPRFQNTEKRSIVTKTRNSNEKPVQTKIESGFEESGKDNRVGRVKRLTGNAPRKTHGREFDRHSGSDKTGVKATEKREGSGSHNWGNVKDFVDLEVEILDLNKDESQPEKPAIESDAPQDVEKKESDSKTMTVSEWRALNKENTIISSTTAARSANNGEDVFSGMNVYKKRTSNTADSDNDVVVPDDETDSKGRRQIKMNVEFSGRNNNRRSRGGFTNNRFTNVNKEEKKNAGAVDVLINLDENEFPTLS